MLDKKNFYINGAWVKPKSVSKRFKLTGSGKIKRNKAGHSHMLIRRDNDVKRAAKKSTLVAASDEKKVKKMMGK